MLVTQPGLHWENTIPTVYTYCIFLLKMWTKFPILSSANGTRICLVIMFVLHKIV